MTESVEAPADAVRVAGGPNENAVASKVTVWLAALKLTTMVDIPLKLVVVKPVPATRMALPAVVGLRVLVSLTAPKLSVSRDSAGDARGGGAQGG